MIKVKYTTITSNTFYLGEPPHIRIVEYKFAWWARLQVWITNNTPPPMFIVLIQTAEIVE